MWFWCRWHYRYRDFVVVTVVVPLWIFFCSWKTFISVIRISCLEGCVQKKGFTKEVCLKTGIRLVKCLKNGYYTNSRVHCYGYIIDVQDIFWQKYFTNKTRKNNRWRFKFWIWFFSLSEWRIFDLLQKVDTRQVCVIADWAAIGAEMNRLYKQCQARKNIHLYLPESFEWIILNSGLLRENVVREILQNPEEYIDSSDFFSWERYFTKLLIKQTEGTYLKYKKSRLNKVYLHEKNKDMILKSIKGNY